MTPGAHRLHRAVDVPLPLPQSTMLPKAARDLLIQAAKAAPQDRRRAVDDATDKVKLMYPAYFHHEEEGVTP